MLAMSDITPSPPKPADLKKALRKRVSELFLGDFLEYRTAVLTDGTISDKARLVEFQAKIMGLEEDRKQDLNTSLPVFNFTFFSSAKGGPTPIGQGDSQPQALEVLTDMNGVEDAQLKELPPTDTNTDGMLDNLDGILDDMLPIEKDYQC